MNAGQVPRGGATIPPSDAKTCGTHRDEIRLSLAISTEHNHCERTDGAREGQTASGEPEAGSLRARCRRRSRWRCPVRPPRNSSARSRCPGSNHRGRRRSSSPSPCWASCSAQTQGCVQTAARQRALSERQDTARVVSAHQKAACTVLFTRQTPFLMLSCLYPIFCNAVSSVAPRKFPTNRTTPVTPRCLPVVSGSQPSTEA